MKIKKKHFKLFRNECQHWIDEYGLREWDTSFKHDWITDAYGQINYDSLNYKAVIFLAKEADPVDPVHWTICYTAFHEVCHLLLAVLTDMASDVRSNEAAGSETHRIIERLANTQFRDYYEKVYNS